MSKIKLFVIPFIVFTLFGGVVFADFNLSDWQYRYELILPSTTGEKGSTYYFTNLTSELLSNLKENLTDLRVISSSGEEMPYQIVLRQGLSKSVRVPVKIFNLSTIPNEETTLVLDLTSTTIHNELFLEINHSNRTEDRNYLRNVSVFGSNDNSSWRLLNGDGKIFGFFENGANITGNSIQYPDSTFKYLKLTVYDNGESPLNIVGATVGRQVGIKEEGVSYDTSFTVKENTESKTSEIFVDLGVDGIPHRQARLVTTSNNFSRVVSVYESSDGLGWKRVGSDYIFDINTEKFKGNNLTINYPESNRRHLKIEIENRDNKPLNLKNVSVTGIVRRLIFATEEQDEQYFIYTDNEKASRPSYDISLTLDHLDEEGLIPATIGPRQDNSEFIATKLPLTERNPNLLVIILALVVLLLAILFIFIFKKGR